MPVTATDTDTFPATLQRPSNGELADSASIQQFVDPLTKRTRYAYNRSLPGNFDLARAPYSAVGSGAVDDYPAFAAAAAECSAAGGGTLWLTPGKNYRLDSELVLDGTVSIRVAAGKTSGGLNTRLIRNHAGRLLRVNAPSTIKHVPTLLEGLRCEDSAANSQPMVWNENGSLTLLRCYLHGAAAYSSQPLILSQGGEGEVVRLRECYIAPDTGGVGIRHEIGLLDLQGNVFAFPTTYSSAMIDIESSSAFDEALATILGNDFWASAMTSGDPIAIVLDGLAWAATISANHFRGAASNPLTAMAWGAGGERQLNVGANGYEQCVRYSAAAGAIIGDSKLDLGNWKDTAPGTSYALPYGYGNMVLVSTNTSGTDIVLPYGLVEGQILTLTYVNDTVNTVAINLLTTPVTGDALPGAIGPGQTLTGTFAWEKPNGSGVYSAFRWIQKGTWGIGTTLVA